MKDYAELEKRLRATADSLMWAASAEAFREAADACADVRGLVGLLERALEELRLIRAKDTGSVYDVTLRLDMAAVLDVYRKEQGLSRDQADDKGKVMDDKWFRVKFAWPNGTTFEMKTCADSARVAHVRATEDADYQQLLATSGDWCSLTVCGIARPTPSPAPGEKE